MGQNTKKRWGFSSNVLPPVPLRLRKVPKPVLLDPNAIRGPVEIQRVLDLGKKRRDAFLKRTK
jgi:hypothetical protein